VSTRRISAAGASFFVVDDKESFWDRFESGAWEPETLRAVAASLGPGSTLVDIGAWVGPIALTAAALGARVVALEPDPRAHELLVANADANPAFRERIIPLNKAVAVWKGRIRLGSPRKPGDSMGSVLAVGRGRPEWEAETVTPAMVAELAGIASRIVLKIDIEGAEYELAPALGPLLGSATAAAIVAFHPRLLQDAGRSAPEIDALTGVALASFRGFSARDLDGAGAGPAVSTTANSTILFERADP
jgi:FkbM family methyltransferase